MKHKGNENKPYIEAMREIRPSDKAGTHADKRTKRARTRQSSEYRAIREGGE